jgi:hypothetical protein
VCTSRRRYSGSSVTSQTLPVRGGGIVAHVAARWAAASCSLQFGAAAGNYSATDGSPALRIPSCLPLRTQPAAFAPLHVLTNIGCVHRIAAPVVYTSLRRPHRWARLQVPAQVSRTLGVDIGTRCPMPGSSHCCAMGIDHAMVLALSAAGVSLQQLLKYKTTYCA